MKIRGLLIAAVAAGMFFAVSGAGALAQEAAACDPGAAAVLTLQNKAVTQIDKYWGDPLYFGGTITHVLAFKLMWTSGKSVRVSPAKSEDVMKLEGIADVDAVRAALGENPPCHAVLGVIEQAVVDTKKSANVLVGQKKFFITAKVRLMLVDVAQGKVELNESYTNEHETSTLLEALSDSHKTLYFPLDPVEAGGNPLGIPFSRVFTNFSKRAIELMN